MINTRHLANAITLSRILGIGIIFWLTPYKTNYWQSFAITIFTIICITDFLDGWIARKLNIVTDIGKILDPLADKILVLIFLPLLEMQIISSFPVFIILAREFAIMGLRVASAKNGTIVAAKVSGKIKTAFTLPVCGLLLARVPVQEVALPFFFVPLNLLRLWIVSWPNWIFTALIWSTVAITIWSFLDYFGNFIWGYYVQKAGGNKTRAKRLLKTLLPNTITFLNLFCGVIATIYAIFGYFHIAVLLVLIGTLLDAIDGRLARILDAESKFGADLDSTADFVNFGIAPAVVIFRMISTLDAPLLTVIGLSLAICYYAAVHFRLLRFSKGGHSAHFQGLPSPVGASLVVIAAISTILSKLIIFIPLIILSTLFMISKIRYSHMDMAKKGTFLGLLPIPTMIFFILTILKLMNINIAHHTYVYEILFGLILIYVVSPTIIYLTKKK